MTRTKHKHKTASLFPGLLLPALAYALLAPATHAQSNAPGYNTPMDVGDFDSTYHALTGLSTGGNGANPVGPLVVDPANGLFYGTTKSGANGSGVLFSFNPVTDTITDVGNFGVSNGSGGDDGQFPEAALVYNAARGLFYGTASRGGANGSGDVFTYNPSNNDITDVGDFNVANGSGPAAALVYDSAKGLFYGTADLGGANSDGDVFTFNPNDADPATSITDVGDFDYHNGANPVAALVYDSTSGLYYGTASEGGYFQGDVFAFNPASTAPSNSITDVADFSVLINPASPGEGDNGEIPQAPLVYDPVNSLFYGTTTAGAGSGGLPAGDVFSFNPSNDVITDVGDFNVANPSGGTNGEESKAALVYNAATNVFYGTALYGGANGQGNVFEFNPTVSSTSASITDVGDFNGLTGDNANSGAYPSCALLYDAANGLYYSVTEGGANNAGDVFSWTPPVIATSLTVTASTSSVITTQSLTVTARVTPAAAGTVAFTLTPTHGSIITETASSGSSGQSAYTFATRSLPAGTYALSATFTPTPPTAYSRSTASGGNVTALYPSTGTLMSSAPSGSIAGQSVTFTLTVPPAAGSGQTPTGTATFSVNGGAGVSVTLGGNGVASYTTSLLSVGMDTLTVTYGGYADYAPFAAPLSVTQSVAPAPAASTLTISADPITPTMAQSVILTADVLPTPATGTVTFALTPETGNAVTRTAAVTNGIATATVPAGTLGAGTYSLSAAFAPANASAYTASTSNGAALTVTNATTTTLASSFNANSAVFGQSVTFTATVTSASGTPGGDVVFSVDGTALSPISLTNREAALTLSSLSVGTHTLTAAYSGSSVFAASSTATPLMQTVNVASTPTVLHTFPAGLQMISVPKNYAGVSLANAWTAPAGQGLYTWNGGPNYLTGRTLPAPGQGAWVILANSASLYDTGAATNTSTPFSISLIRGWNLIGDPFASAVAESGLEVTDGNRTLTLAQANAAAVVSSTLYTYRAGDTQYEAQGILGSLLPYQGYWVYAFQGGETLTMTALQ